MTIKETRHAVEEKLEERYEVTEEDKEAGPPNAERRGLSRILFNSGLAAIIILTLIGLLMLF